MTNKGLNLMDLIFNLNSFTPLGSVQDIGLLVVRIIFGITFLYYGQFKIRDLKSIAEDYEEARQLTGPLLFLVV